MTTVVLCLLGSVLSCGGDEPIEPPAQVRDGLTSTAAAQKDGKLQIDDGALSVDDMLSNPLFQAVVQGIDEPSLAEPLNAAVDALAAGQTAKARNLIGQASAEAEALEDDQAVETLVLWSALTRFFEAAELL